MTTLHILEEARHRGMIKMEELEELKVCSVEISSLDERHLAIGPRDSVEPRFEYRARGTDERVYHGDTRRTNELKYSARDRQTDEYDGRTNARSSAGIVIKRERRSCSPPIDRVAAQRYSCSHEECRDEMGQPISFFSSVKALQHHTTYFHIMQAYKTLEYGARGSSLHHKVPGSKYVLS
jgi:hypothetical protein